MEKKPYNPFAEILDLLVLLLTLLAPALGGSTLPWQQAVIVLSGAGLILASPPSRFLPKWTAGLLGAALLCAFLPFLPASLAPDPWRETLAGPLRLQLPGTITLQPWLTLDGIGLLFAGLVWGAFLLTRRWELPREVLLEVFAGGLLLLTLAAVAIHHLHLEFPLWRVEAGAFGFFPHRNQTATLLGLGGVITLALFARRLHQRHWLALLWGAAYGLTAVGLVLNYSRAGILIFFFGSLAWLVYSSHCSRNYFALGMGLTGLFALVALFVLFGGETWERFRPKQPAATAAPVLDFRVLVQKDALGMAGLSSWHGLGFGNLEPAFQQHRTLSAVENRLEHPDSDWLWLGLELGLPGTLLLLAAIAGLLRPCWPFQKKSQRRLRVAALICTLFFLLHGIVDVSGHRLGTVWPALFLFAMARNRHDQPLPRPGAAAAFRVLGAALALLGAVWLAGCFTDLPLRTAGRLDELKDRARLAAETKDHAVAVGALTEAMEIAPLDFRLYFQRAAARLALNRDRAGAALDFARARHLEPHASKLLLEEGNLWLPADRDQAVEAWAESIRRARNEAQDRFQMMLLAADGDAFLRRALWVITDGDAWLKLLFLRSSQGGEFRAALAAWLNEEPPLKGAPPVQLRELFALWFDRGDRDLLERQLLSRADWTEQGRRWLAELAAAKKDFPRACDHAFKAGPAPAMPPRQRYRHASAAELRAEFLAAAGQRRIAAGVTLAFNQLDGQREDEALATLAEVAALPGCPRYVPYLQAQTLAQKGRWEEAWASLRKYSAAATSSP